MANTREHSTSGACVISSSRHSANQASSSIANRFRYSRLLKHGNIRLLRLLPHNDKKALIQCQLFEYPLQEPGQGLHLYDALSYVWGSEKDKKPILIHSNDKGDGSFTASSSGNNRPLLVTANLHAVLSHLRDQLLERVLWIDAICINQEDDEEKGQQVQSMAKIYAYANRVIVWLGEAASDSGEAFEALRKAAREQRAYQIIDNQTQQGILALLGRPWFQRIWVRDKTTIVVYEFADKSI
jgi:hypothetical protein